MSKKEQSGATSPLGYRFEDYRDAFMASITGQIMKSGLMMAEEGHFNAIASNLDGLAVSIAKKIQQRRQSHFPTTLAERVEP